MRGHEITPFPVHRFAEFAPLSAEQLALIESLTRSPRFYPKNSLIRIEGTKPDCVWLLHAGWAGAACDLPDARRQLAKIHLPGDVLGSTSMCLTAAGETLFAITEVIASPVPFSVLGQAFAHSPRLATTFLLSVQKERLAVIHKLAEVGRLSAFERVAGLMLDLLQRGRSTGVVRRDVIPCPLTQEQIADLLGLTSVHVNRMLRELNQAGLILGTSKNFIVLDEQRLRQLAPFQPSYVENPGWLPPHA